MLLDIVILLAGLGLLFFAGDYLVKGAVGLAENLGITPLVIGLTVVAFGTSAPELVISVNAALSGAPGIAVGNVVGSNIANVLLVLGLPALISPIVANQPGLRRNLTAMLILTAASLWLLSNAFIGRLEGALLFAAICAFVAWQVYEAKTGKLVADHDIHDDVGNAPHSGARIALFLLAGLIGLPIAAHLTVTGASSLASSFGISDAVIGLTIVAVGTSLPELATTLAAAFRKTAAVAIGNIVGSNIFNLAGILGLTALIQPVSVDERIVRVDMWVMLGCALVLALLGYFRISAGRVFGIAMTLAFVTYIGSFFV
jgi:cation:H+ antiporter